MAEIDLKAYTTRAKELESAIYTQKRLMSSQESIIKEQHPKKPQKAEVVMPIKPESPEPASMDVSIIGLSILALVIGAVGLLCLLTFEMQWPIIIFLIIGAFGGFGVYKAKTDANNLNQIAEETYKKESDRYPQLLEEYYKESALSNERYQKALNGYNANVSKYNQRYNETMKKHNTVLSTLEAALEQVYAENVLFPKYRNLVAITAINEYLLSGRCDKLEGPDGAYNLYEMELRQNIIITQLSSIIDNLEQIRSNQYSLYEELQKSNYTINEILSETRKMKETAKLTAYFAGVTALAETSPKYYHGIVM